MQQLLVILLVISAFSIICLVLLQQGKGSDVGAAFGSGASNTVFGSQGSMPFFMKLTVLCSVVFFVACLGLSRLSVIQAGLSTPSTAVIKRTAPKEKVPLLNLPMQSAQPSKKAEKPSSLSRERRK